MKRSLSLLTLGTLLSVSLTPAPSRAEQESKPVQVASLGQDDMGLYFDQAELTTVESATHAPKPITQVAENISIITAQDIERWNAHSLQDVLAHVPGVLVSFNGREVASGATIHIQGSNFEDVQIFLDGMRWNDLPSDISLTNQIPVEIIDRVEIIKGPASSTWGSAYGGVVNIITKSTGSNATPSGTVTASYGERQTQGASAQLAGQAGTAGYFLHGGSLSSDGLRDDRWLDSSTLYANFSTPLPSQTTLSATMGRFHPDYINATLPDWAYVSQWDETSRFVTANLSRPMGDHLHLQLYGSLLDHSYNQHQEVSSSPIGDSTQEQDTHSGAVRLYGDLGRHSLSIGADTYRLAYDEYSFGVSGQNNPKHEETWALYANDTIHLGRATLTPGLRYDSISIAAPQLCPSLGLTYRANDSTLLRALFARGFRRPVPNYEQSDFPNFPYQTNPVLESETVRTYQAGVENTAIPNLRLKASLFRHETDHRWLDDPDLTRNLIYINGDSLVRNGVEIELETERWHGLALIANYTFVRFTPSSYEPSITVNAAPSDPGDTWFSNLIFDYQGPWGLKGRLSGNYTWLNADLATPGWDGSYDTMTWDLTATKVFNVGERYRCDLFATANNLFDGNQYSSILVYNTGRWLEAGMRLHF